MLPRPLDDELVKELYVEYKTVCYVLCNNDFNDSHKGTIHVNNFAVTWTIPFFASNID